MKNPPWTRQEMILAADVADDLAWRGVNATEPRVVELSNILKTSSFHPSTDRNATFRSPNSVAMKINNLRASHPEAQGAGLRTSAAERPIVEEFLTDRSRMKNEAAMIRTHVRPEA